MKWENNIKIDLEESSVEGGGVDWYGIYKQGQVSGCF